MALTSEDKREIGQMVANLLQTVFEQFAVDEHENYKTIEVWASQLTGSPLDGSPLGEDGTPLRDSGTTTTIIQQVVTGTLGDVVQPEEEFGIPSDSGSAENSSRADHTHGTPPNPVTYHQEQTNPHPQYVQEYDESDDWLPQYQLRDEEGQPDGYPGLDIDGLLIKAQTKTWHNESVWYPGYRNLTVDYDEPTPENIGDLWVELLL